MDLKPAIALLDQECDELLTRVDGSRPDSTPLEFALLRAKSLGRSMLRRAESIGATTPAALDAFYKGVRERTIKDTTPE